ncbi:hypothetical protein BDW42DRAFT_110802 [Aspergillus taichungensis]|uniref:Uncharacterized protein n=1 Tax=Aspergillus taichungensis TaxID=482145 RepID=A0A2J5HTW7_9EURO|nr:hypothetical protein BDW42DRAFT_110802 [Aspergillus taichungensis]
MKNILHYTLRKWLVILLQHLGFVAFFFPFYVLFLPVSFSPASDREGLTIFFIIDTSARSPCY